MFPDQPGKLFPEIQVRPPEEEGLIPFGTEALKRGVFRVLPKQISQAVDFMTDLGLALDPFQFLYTKEQREKLKQVDERLRAAGWGGKSFEMLGNLVNVEEAPEKYRQPIKSLSELKDPKRAIQVIGEQGPAMLGNIAAVIANPAYGAALMFGLEGGETYAGLNEIEKQTGKPINQFEKLAIATTVGSVNAALEKLGIDVILGKVPGLKSRLAQLALSPITEATTESLQEINQVIAEKTGKRDFELTIEDLQRIQTAAYGGAVLGIVGGGSSQAIQSGVEAIDKKFGEKTSEDVLEERLDEAFKAAPILEGEQDAEGIRSDEGQIREPGTIQLGGEAQGRQDIQQPEPAEPGRQPQKAEQTQKLPVEKPDQESQKLAEEKPEEGGRVLATDFVNDVVSTPGRIGREKVEKFVEENPDQVPGMIEELRKLAPESANASQVLDIMTQATGEKPKTPKEGRKFKKPTQPRKEGAATVRSWLRGSGLRIKTEDLKRYGFGEGSQENRNLILQVGAKDGVGADEAAMQAIEQGIIPPPPPEYNPADWFMEKVRNNELTLAEDERQKVISEQRKAAEEAPPEKITDKESLAKNLVFINPVQAEAVSEIADARAEAWAAETGKDKSEWYQSRIAGVETGISPEYAKQIEEEGRGLPQEVMFQAAENAPVFYSKLSKTIDEKMGGAAQPQQLMTMLKNAGVKDEELQWSGLEQFLAGKEKVSKAEVQKWVEENSVQVQETVKDNSEYTHGDRIGTKFHRYVLPGGENYRELLLTLPVKQEKAKAIPKQIIEQTNYGKQVIFEGYKPGSALEANIYKWERTGFAERGQEFPGGGKGYRATFQNKSKNFDTEQEALNWAKAQQAEVLQNQATADINRGKYFRSSHFDEPNILAHVRFNERKDADGKRVLFLEEVQSDWHQAGRKKGYKGEGIKRQQELDAKSARGENLTDEEKREYNSITAQREFNVPDAPFKTAWPELAFKRMMRWAAENGFDKIAWTTGEQQAERYDLSKQVDEVKVLKTDYPDGGRNYKVIAYKDGNKLIDRGGLSENDLAETIGKELAEKAINNINAGEKASFKGENLKVGGEGMKAFYDKMLVNTANKLGKKFGAQVDIDNVGTGALTVSEARAQGIEPTHKAGEKEYFTAVHSLPITDKMRFTLLNEGMPLFQRNKGAVEFTQDGRAIIHAFETADVSTAVHELAHIFRKDLNESDQKTVLDWAGEETWTVAAEEKFARGFEKYLRDGEAPTPALKQVFENFKRWLTQIYKTVSGSAIDVNITPEIKDVFDRLLTVQKKAATEAEIKEIARGEIKKPSPAAKIMAEEKETPPLPPTETPSTTKAKKHVPGERSFPKTLEEGELEGGTDRVYEVFADKKAIKLAKNRIEENEESALRYAQDDTQRLSKEQVTTGILLLNKMKNDYEAAETQAEKENLAEKQVELANSLSRRLTQAGQSIQAASIVARLSPEGLLLYTQKKINQINKTRPETRQVTITPKDVESINQISKNIKEAVEIDENVKDVVGIVNKIGKGEKLTADELKRMVDLNNQLQKEYGDKPAKKKTIKQAAVDRLSKAEEAARKRLKDRGYNLSAGIDPGALADFAIIGAAKVGKTGIKFLEWSGEMVSEFGEDIRPHLKRIFGKSVDLWKSENKRARESRKLQSELNGILRKMESSTDITETELSAVRDLLDRIDTYSGEAREEALYELQDFMRTFEPVTLGRKLATAQTVAQLLNPKTNVRNILGNELFFRLERLNRYLTTPIDFAVSKLTGKERTVTFRKGGQGGFWAGFIKGAKAGWQGHNIQNLETQFNLQGQTFRSKYNPLTWMEKAMGATLRGFDFAAYNRAYNQFLGEQAELSIINKGLEFESKEARKAYIDEFMKNADLHIQEMAHDYGKYITFQDENRISNAFVGLKRIMNLNRDFGIGDFVLKYPKTPANLLARALEYSPAGIAKSISILNKPFTDPNFRRREAMQALTRAITGTMGLTGLGAVLYSMGALSGGEDKDRDVREFKTQQTGERNYQVNVSAIKRFLNPFNPKNAFNPEVLKKRPGDYLVSYDWAQPVAISIAAGANMAKDLSENALNLRTFGDIAYSSLDAALNTLAEQPLVRGVQEAFGSSYGGSIVKRLSRILTGVPASFTPTFFSQVAQFTDNNRRITYDPNPLQQAMNKVIYKLPFVRDNLREVYKTIGGDVAEGYKDGSNTLFNVFFNPAFVSKYSLDPEIQKILLPYDMERRSKQFPKVAPYTIRAAKSTLKKYGIETDRAFEEIRLEPEDIEEFQKRMAEDITKRFAKIHYYKLKRETYEDQEKRLADEVTESYNYTKDWFFKNRAKKYIEGE